MNYRHIYHAGNFADVWKHAVLVALFDALKQKAKPFCYLDTHAGIGRYDLQAEEARKTAEADKGIASLWQATDLPELLQQYRQLIADDNEGNSLRYYPGSPWLANLLRREDDSLICNELHPADVETLRDLFHRQRKVSIRNEDAYQSLTACLPPKEKRGLVLIDPPFEKVDEFRQLLDGLKNAYQRWPTGIYTLWYPIKSRVEVQQFYRRLELSGIRRILRAELNMKRPTDGEFTGSGLVMINPPWQIEQRIQPAGDWLARHLGGAEANCTIDWLVPE
ncbi:23S rRNA (adenine(2030)-N(6))-methyltransferase RlmJ [Pokkaliibacter sp. MBI-7]|uniref:23S rRNA (adenine(2030)-N(6))-methyltransferase RlmJ n=1 Tax=Pokkaliibacter sp. MBI-7 TaxID=3040600 RepID=UPI00244AE3EE|nr:23S rRNA (adenine(2030)-N(6))-methyltransferase RlmJ [Pokkaliibacter sp. MBI-7]MDH2432114.1 23S rRNA (adenine(2030)-N(6))-methyltransferase RlmJ [Pokkaliibacter sp. MBI-7]